MASRYEEGGSATNSSSTTSSYTTAHSLTTGHSQTNGESHSQGGAQQSGENHSQGGAESSSHSDSSSKYTGQIKDTTQSMIDKYQQEYVQSQTVSDAYNKLQSIINNKPTYQSNYDEQLAQMYNNIINRDKFSYDMNQDALYQMYKDQYMQQGKSAMKDTIAQASALTGGYGNSYAQTAGQQAYQSYLDELNNKVPELYEMAYQKYKDEGDEMRQNLAATADMRDREYGQYRDEVADYQQDRDFANSSYWNEKNFDYANFANSRDYWTSEFWNEKKAEQASSSDASNQSTNYNDATNKSQSTNYNDSTSKSTTDSISETNSESSTISTTNASSYTNTWNNVLQEAIAASQGTVAKSTAKDTNLVGSKNTAKNQELNQLMDDARMFQTQGYGEYKGQEAMVAYFMDMLDDHPNLTDGDVFTILTDKYGLSAKQIAEITQKIEEDEKRGTVNNYKSK